MEKDSSEIVTEDEGEYIQPIHSGQDEHEEGSPSTGSPVSVGAAEEGPFKDVENRKQAEVCSAVKPVASYLEDSVTQEKVYDAVLEMIVLGGLPLSIVENRGLQRLFEYGGLQLPSREHLSENVLPYTLYKLEQLRRKFLSDVEFVSISVAEWSKPSMRKSFLAIKAHGWTKDFNRFQVTLDIIDFAEVSHDSHTIKDAICNSLDVYNLRGRVVYAVTDGASAVKRAATDIGVLWIHCLAHSINLVVEDVLRAKERPGSRSEASKDNIPTSPVIPVLNLARHNARTTRWSNMYSSKLQQVQDEMGIAQHRLVMDCVTRWDSVLAMIRSAFKNKEAVNRLIDKMLDRNGECSMYYVSGVDSDVMDGVISILSHFEEITKLASANLELVSSFVPAVVGLRNVLRSKISDPMGKKLVEDLAKGALESMEKRLFKDNASVLRQDHLLLPMFLDPRYCLREDLLSAAEWMLLKGQIALEVAAFASHTATGTSPSFERSGLSLEKRAPVRSQEPSSTLQHMHPQRRALVRLPNFDGAATGFVLQKTVDAEISHFVRAITKYDGGSRIQDVAEFWKTIAPVTPHLSRYARKILSAPLGSVATERLFSVATSFLQNKFRSCLGSHTISDFLMLHEFYSKGSENYFLPDCFAEYDDEDDTYEINEKSPGFEVKSYSDPDSTNAD